MVTLAQLTNDSSYDAVAQGLIGECKRRKYTRDESIGVTADGIQESGLKPKAHNPAGWDGVFQQDASYPGRFNVQTQITGFLDRLDVKRKSPGHGDIWLNIFWLQQRPSEASAADAYNDPQARRAYLTEIQSRTTEATRLVNLYYGDDSGDQPVTDRPDFNEINNIGIENGTHSSIRSQLPKNWLLHTQEGNGNAEDLFRFLMSTTGANAVSYHYTIAEDPNDHGVTVVDVVDTDRYSWAVLNANVFTINACFAGSFASQTRAQWLANFRNAIRVAAYLAVEDCKKYPTIAATVIEPPYANHGSGISDHRFVTDALGIGSHTDVGGPMAAPWSGFPWDVFESDVKSFLAPVVVGPDTPPPDVDDTPIWAHPTNDAMIADIWDQLRGPRGKGWPQDKDRTPVESIWALTKKAGI